MSNQEKGWGEWAVHVLRELERLNDNHEALRDKIDDMQKQLSEVKGNLSGLDEVKTWKHNVDEVASPSQIKDLKKDVEELKIFKAKIIAVLTVSHTIGMIILAYLGIS